MWLNSLWTIVRDCVFPPTCPSCGKLLNVGDLWCSTCLSDLCIPHKVDVNELEFVDEAYCLGVYREGLRYILQDIKFNQKKGVVRKLTPFYNAIEPLLAWPSFDIAVPIPISEKNRKIRGYNQVDILFKKWMHIKQIPWYNVLEKTNHTKPMYGLHKEERKLNILHAYSLKENFCMDCIKNKHILLLDDIFTTGTTVEVVSEILKSQGGVKKITALTIAGGAVI